MKKTIFCTVGLLALAGLAPSARAIPISPFVVNTNNQHRYVLLSAANWATSEAEAVTLGGHLATVRNQTEENWLYAQFSQYGGQARELWIGFNDLLTGGTYAWSSGEAVTYTDWASGEPGTGEDYAAIYCSLHGAPNQWNNYGNTSGDPIGSPINGVVEFTSFPGVILVPAGSVWKYLDNGTDQGTAWRGTDFNDAAWAFGPAQLGYGDGDEATVVGYGPSSSSKYITTYFRRSFTVTNLATLTNLIVRVLRDDGAVVYLNGVEIFRSNMPDTAIGYQTLALATVNAPEESTFYAAPVPLGLLRAGTNVLAVELHQSTASSSDLSFDLELLGNLGLFNSISKLPAPWFNLDLGGPALRGAASVETNSPLWVVHGGGSDIWTSSDQFHFVSAPATGDWDIRARVVSTTQVDPWSKVGVMLRESLDAGARNAFMILTPEHGAIFQWRGNVGGETGSTTSSGARPSWVRVVRTGNVFSGYTSVNGVSWVLVNSASFTMSNSIYAGLVVCAHRSAKVCTTTFASVSGLAANWAEADIGSPSVAGSVCVETNAPSFVIQGGGADISGAADHFHFVAQSVRGNCSIVARVATQGATATGAKAGVMMRESLLAGSRHILMDLTPGSGAQCVVRNGTDATSAIVGTASLAAPYWVALARSGSQFGAFTSSNGLNWAQVGLATISMTNSINVGLAVACGDNGITGAAAFDSVLIYSENGSAPVAVCQNVVTWADASGTAAASINNGSYDPDSGDTITVAQTPPGPYSAGTNVVTLTVTDTHGNSNSCSASVIVLSFGQTVTLVPTGSVWKYLDTGANLGTAWKETNFNDAAWASGPAQLGYGDGDEATVVSYGPSSSSKYTTTYFRRAFYVPNVAFVTNLFARVLRDDGVVVYLNGTEVYRNNMPGGPIGYQTFASTPMSGADETTFLPARIPLGLLRPGTNVLAAEIHQSDLTSSDISFDLELVANSALGQFLDPLPAPWADADIGGPGVMGGASYVTNTPVWMVEGGGGDIWGTSDQLHYVYQAITGDWDIRARVASIGVANGNAKVGLMMRESFAATAMHACVDVTPGYGLEFLWRTTTGGSGSGIQQSGVLAPYWVRLTRVGNVFTGYSSSNGVNWTQVYALVIVMPDQIYAGLEVCARNNAKVCLAAFDHVSGLSANWSQQDIGSPGIAGSVFIETNPPTFLVQGSGANIWSSSDQCHYVFQPITGNCTLQARVAALGKTDAWSKGGVMMRETLSTDAKQALINVTPGNGSQLLWRSSTGGATASVSHSGEAAPAWVRLVRAGNLFEGFASLDGSNWTQVASATINMTDPIYIGLMVNSHDNSVSCEAAFDGVNFLPVVNAVSAVDGDLFYEGDPIELHADAADHDGQVTEVRYFDQATNLIGTASLPPYAFVWTNAPTGMNYIWASAVDDQGVEGAPLPHAVFVAEPDTHVWFHSQFAASAGLTLQGSAEVENNLLRLTPLGGAVGGAWLTDQPFLANGFDCEFQFRISELTGNGADGFAFVIQGNGTSPQLTGAGAGLGYHGVANSLAVEFDTYLSPSDPNDNHISVHSRGTDLNSVDESASLGWTTWIPNMSDGAVHTVRINYQPGMLLVWLDDLTVPALGVAVNFDGYLALDNGRAWVGFTGATGGDTERHDILNWAFVTPNLHPAISLTAPAAGAVFLPTDPIVLTADASDPDASFLAVAFFMDDSYLGTVMESPWQLPLAAVPVGNHTFYAVAGDDLDAWTISAPVTITVNTPPAARCRNVTVAAGGTGTAPANVDGGSYDMDFADEITLTQSPPAPYPLGRTVVTLTAFDTYGASNSCPATVTVVDTTPPEITCPAILVANTAVGCASNVAFSVTASDNSGSASVRCVPPSGSAFPAGATVVTCTATDTAGNSNVCAFTVTVVDTENPQIVCPTNWVVSAGAGQCSQSNLTWTASATDNCAVTNFACLPPSGSAFAVGFHTVVCTATDASGNTAECRFTVTVLDTEPPQLTWPTNWVLNPTAGSSSASNVIFTVTAVDNCDPNPVLVCVPPSGSMFPIGTTPVQCAATDAAGNPNECRFTLRVNAPPLASLLVPATNTTLTRPPFIALLADASDPDGDGVARVDFWAGTNQLGSAASGHLFLWTNPPAGTYSLTAHATDGFGASATSAPVNLTVLLQPPTSYAPVTSSNLNRETGLFLQTVRITNPTPVAFNALRLWIALDTNSAAHGVRVWNAVGTSNGVPFVLSNQPLAPGQSVDLTLEYYIPDRRTMPNPVFTVEMAPAVAPANPSGTVLDVDRAVRLTNGFFRVEFSTLSNRTYYLQYSADLAGWRTASPALTGTGGPLQWLDTGPPQTESDPRAATNRFYRILLLP